MKTLAIAVAAIVATSAAPASAETLNVVTDFGNSAFSYGNGLGATGFQAATFGATCFGNAALSCYANDPNSVPTVVKNNSSTSQSFGTPTIPVDRLLLHPGNTDGTDSVLRFASATGGTYSVNGSFSRLDTLPQAGDGVNVSIYSVNAGVISQLFTGAIGNNDYGLNSFSLSNIVLGQNDEIVFAVNNAGEYTYDSTGLSASIAAVPEPATWGMMLVGFGMIGFGMRRGKTDVRTSVRFA